MYSGSCYSLLKYIKTWFLYVTLPYLQYLFEKHFGDMANQPFSLKKKNKRQNTPQNRQKPPNQHKPRPKTTYYLFRKKLIYTLGEKKSALNFIVKYLHRQYEGTDLVLVFCFSFPSHKNLFSTSVQQFCFCVGGVRGLFCFSFFL